MSVKSEEVKVIISASAGELKRELTGAEKAISKSRGVMEREGGRIEASAKVWKQYRNRTASELSKTLGDVEKTKAKIDKLLEKGPALMNEEDAAYYEAQLTGSGYHGSVASRMTTEGIKRGEQLTGLQAQLDQQQAAVEDLTSILDTLNGKVEETTQAERDQAQAAKSSAEAEKDRVRGLLSFGKGAKSAGNSTSHFGRKAIGALIGVSSLYAALRLLISACSASASRNRELANSLGQIKGNLSITFQSIFQGILPALQTLASWLATVTNYVAQFTGMLFGVKWSTAVSGAKAAAGGIGGVADAANEASKAMHQMGIDELNIMDKQDASGGSGGGGGAGGIANVYAEARDIPNWLDKLKGKLQPLIDAVILAMGKIKNLWDELKEDFKTAWSKWGEPILTRVVAFLTNIVTGIGNVAEKIRNSLSKDAVGETIFDHLFSIIYNILGIFEQLSQSFSDWSSETNSFDFLIEGVNGLFTSLDTLSSTITDIVNPLLSNFTGLVLEGVVQGTGVVLDVLGLLANVIAAVIVAVNYLGAVFSAVFQLIVGIVSGNGIAKSIEEFKENMGAINEGADEAFGEIGENMTTLLGDIGTNLADLGIDALEAVFSALDVDSLTSGFTDSLRESLGSEGVDTKVTFTGDQASADAALSIIPDSVNVNVNFQQYGGRFNWGWAPPLRHKNGGIIQAANGGIIPAFASGGSLGTSGQLFIAREAGPELVAGIGGGRTAVMNNDQIVRSVSDGVYQAVKDAMGGGFKVDVNTKLICDSREIAKASQRGMTAMGKQFASQAFA